MVCPADKVRCPRTVVRVNLKSNRTSLIKRHISSIEGSVRDPNLVQLLVVYFLTRFLIASLPRIRNMIDIDISRLSIRRILIPLSGKSTKLPHLKEVFLYHPQDKED